MVKWRVKSEDGGETRFFFAMHRWFRGRVDWRVFKLAPASLVTDRGALAGDGEAGWLGHRLDAA